MTYTPALPPYSHQKEALRLSRGRAAFALFMEMGTGKTKVILDEIFSLWMDGEIRCAVVIAPKGVYLNWPNREIPTHVLPATLAEVDMCVWGATGRDRASLEKRAFTRNSRLKLLFVNTEAFSFSKKAEEYVRKFVQTHGDAYCVVDESTGIKTPTANRTKTVVRLGKLFKYRRIATGSPVTRSPLDLYSQMEFLDEKILGFGSFYSFRARYAVMQEKYFGGRKVKIVVGYRNSEELSEVIAPHSYRVLKEDCLDLPAKVYETRVVEMTDEQKRLYQEVLENATAQLGEASDCPNCGGTGEVHSDLDNSGDPVDLICGVCDGQKVLREGGHVTATEVIVQILRLHQILCGHVMDELGVVTDVPSRRVDALLEIIEETSGKVIIWSRYRRDIEKIVEALSKEYGKESVVEYHGGTKQKDREIASERFQNDPTCRFMVSNAQTGGYGNTWTAASTVVYYSNDYDLEKRLQSEDRAHRAGQTKSVTYVDLICPGTVEEKIVKSLRAKIDISTAIMGDGYRAWLV